MAIQQPQTAYLQIIRRLLLLLLAGGMAVGCSKTPDPVPDPDPQGPASHTMLLYMPGQDLFSFYLNNIRGIEQAVADNRLGNGRVLVCYQPASHTRATLLELRYDAKQKSCVREIVKEYERFLPEDPASLRELFADVPQLAPARSYGLTIGCHGSAWIPTDAELSPKINIAAGQRLTTRTEISAETPAATRAFGDKGHRMEIRDLAGVVEGLPYRFDYLIFDACFMANIETLYDLRRAFDYVVASPCEIMGAGFPYARAIPDLFATGGPDLPAVCHTFWYFYEYDWNTISGNAQSGCISLAVMGELEALADAAAAVQQGPQRAYEPGDLQYYEGMSRHLFYDFGQYMQAICGDEARYAQFAKQFDRAFPAGSRLHTQHFFSEWSYQMIPVKRYSGVSTSEPATRDQELLVQTDWYRRTHPAE